VPLNTDTPKSVLGLCSQVTRLVEITSNIWGTKFRFTGLVSFLPDDLGSVTYKTSLRQMTVTIFELTSDLRPQTHDPNYNPNQFSESEDEPFGTLLRL
jgi:hypothetical protein